MNTPSPRASLHLRLGLASIFLMAVCGGAFAAPRPPTPAKPVLVPASNPSTSTKPVAVPTANPVAVPIANPVAVPTAKPVAVPTAKPSSASRTAAEDDDVGAHDSRFTDTELGRALALAEREPRKAIEALKALETKMPWLSDVLDYHIATARSHYDTAAARRELETFLSAHNGSVLLGDASAQLARLVEADGDVARATSLAERYGRGGEDGNAAAAVCLSAGRLLAGKSASQGYPYLQCARTKAPLSNAARSAYEIVTSLRDQNPELRPSDAPALMSEAKLLAREGRGAAQVETLGILLARFPGSTLQSEAELAYGRGLGRATSKAAGADFFEKKAAAASGAHKAKLLYEGATLRWNDDHNQEAKVGFERMLAMKTGSGDEQQALYALARISDTDGRRSDAIRYYGQAAAAARGAVRADSQWRQGWVSYRAKDYETAERSFASMATGATRGSDTDGRAEALYWQGRCLERLGRKQEARERFAEVTTEFPVGYYAAVAEQRLGRRSGATTAVREPLPPASLPPAASLAIRRATTLREAGLVTLASRDLAARLADFDAATRRAVLPALPSSGAYDAAFRIAAELNEKDQISREEVRVYFYPRAYAGIVEREATKAGIDPVLVYSIMRQESAFASTAVSSAKALGLLQLLESTARRVAASSGLPEPSAEDLFHPEVSIRLGVRYLAELSKLFHGNTALMAAAYNAGETAAGRWQELATKFDEDEMIEQISYRETRGYVKAILRNMRNYRSIYSYGATGAP